MHRKKALFLLSMLMFFSFAFSSICAGEDTVEEFNPEEDTGFFYTIQKGDTLWDLSQKFYSSEWDWPGLWEINKDIKNPHWIYPGKIIRVFYKDKMAKKSEAAPQTETPVIAPPPVIPKFSYTQIDMVGFVKTKAIDSIGSIIKEEDTNIMIGSDDLIFIEPAGNGSLIPGDIYQVYETEPISHKETKFSGIKHIIKASIKIVEHKTSYVTATVLKSIRTVREGDLIMPYYKREGVFTVEKDPAPIDAVLLGSEDNDLMINDNYIAFISKGRQDNIVPGQMYTVFQENIPAKGASATAMFTKKNPVKLDPLSAGRLIVLHTEDTASTVMIMSSRYDIRVGNMVH